MVLLIAVATILRLRHPSTLDIYMDATAWLVTGLTVAIVVARAVFAAGAVNYHRVIGAVLLYLDIGLIFVALFCFVALCPWCFQWSRPAAGQPRCGA
jgi:hypothetical protein